MHFAHTQRVIDAPCYFDTRWQAGVSDIQFWSLSSESDYFKLLVMKVAYITVVLEQRFNILMIDADIAFYGDPHKFVPDSFPHFTSTYALTLTSSIVRMMTVHRYITSRYQNYDLVLQSDARPTNPNTTDWICAGFLYMRHTPATLQLSREWERLMVSEGAPDQDVLQLLLTGHGQKWVRCFPTTP